MEQNTYRVALSFVGEALSLNQITSEMGVQPTLVWRSGDKLPRCKTAKATCDCWELECAVSERSSLEDRLEALLTMVLPRKEAIRRVCQLPNVRAQLEIVAYQYDSCNMDVWLTSSTVKQIAELGVELWIDMYVFSTANETRDDESGPAGVHVRSD